MRAVILTCVLALTMVGSAFAQFEWPQTDPHALPDARLSNEIQTARDDAREATQQAAEATAAAGQARRLVATRSAIGRGPQPTTVGDGVVMAAVPYGDDGGRMLGTLRWSTGAVLTGLVSAGTGELTPEPESALSEFSGWMQGATPMTGIFEFRNGDQFRGHYLAGNNASGIYFEAGGERRFVGVIDFEAGGYRPLRGQVEDRRGRPLAIVNVRRF